MRGRYYIQNSAVSVSPLFVLPNLGGVVCGAGWVPNLAPETGRQVADLGNSAGVLVQSAGIFGKTG